MTNLVGYINNKDMERLMKKIVKDNPGILINQEDFLLHCKGTRDIISEALDDIFIHYPDFRDRLNRSELETAGFFHDVGRPFNKDQTFHELRGAEWLERKALEKCIVYPTKLGMNAMLEAVTSVYRIAQTIRSHFVVLEQFKLPFFEKQRKEFESREDCDLDLLIPHTWNEALVVYGELSNVRGKVMSFEERVKDLRERYRNYPDYEDPNFLEAIEIGLKRVERVYKRVQNFRDGKLDHSAVVRYGFLI